MQVTFPQCSIIGCETFTSKKGTECGVLRWFDLLEGKAYRTMVFGEDCLMLNGVGSGMQCSVTLNVQPSRRDDTIEMYLSKVGASDAGIAY